MSSLCERLRSKSPFSWISHDNSNEFHMATLVNFTWARLASNFSREFHMSSLCERLRSKSPLSWISHELALRALAKQESTLMNLAWARFASACEARVHSHEFGMSTLMNLAWPLSWIWRDHSHEFGMTTLMNLTWPFL